MLIENCGDSSKTVTYKYTFEYGGKFEFYLVIFPASEGSLLAPGG